ncbi:MAG: type II toxin-antitoxin system Phd/YefM family antitoxin [Pseudomonadota bacterium]|nr:type II toxin-antitoxin system Phd/YefM family antitoxin [Pseudomonadota bacterium]
MKTLPSREVQSHFGAVLDVARREPVTVTRRGRPVVVMMSVEQAQAGQRALAGREMSDFLRRLSQVEAAQSLSDSDIHALVNAHR